MSDFGNILMQAQKMQRDVERAQEELAKTEVKHSVNGVEVIAQCDFTIKSITIAPEILESGDNTMLADILQIAVNGVLDKVRAQTESHISGIAAGLNLPGLT